MLCDYLNVILNICEEGDGHSLLESDVLQSALLVFLFLLFLLVSDSEGLIKGGVLLLLACFIELGFGSSWTQKADLKKLGVKPPGSLYSSCPPQGITEDGSPCH